MTESGKDGGVEFRILGRVELWAGGERCELGSRRERSLLAILLWDPGHLVPAEVLVRRIWDGQPAEGAHKALHENVSRLRKSLRAAGGTGRELAHRSGSYVLDVSRSDVDVWRFRALRDQARTAVARDDELVIRLLGEADSLWHGVALGGVDGDWAEGARLRLHEERFAATRQRIEAGLRLERYADLVGEVADLVRQRPLDEAVLDLHLRALYGSGRKAEALSAFQRAERRWRDESGSDLSPALRDLHRLMLNDDPTLGPAAPPRTQPTPAATTASAAPAGTMLRDDPDFTGRRRELDALLSWLDDDRARSSVPVAVISGMAGSGKTALAVHAAHALRERYPDQLYLRLHGHDADGDPLRAGAALGTLLRMLGLPDNAIPPDTEGRAGLWRHRLNGRSTLVVLDDAVSADQVQPLLPGAPGSLVLVTTRRRTLGLSGMLHIPLGPMAHADATELLARAAGPGAGRPADWPAAARVVRLCGRLPLAIRLAGGRLRNHPAWGMRDLAARLADMRTADRDLTAAFALSYRYLTAEQQWLFRCLATHPGDGFSAYAAAAMAGSDPVTVTERTLDVLLDHFLIEEPSSGRYSFHSLLRDYAAELAGTDPEPARRPALGRLLDYYVQLAEQADRVVHPSSRPLAPPSTAASSAVLPPLRTRDECLAMLNAEKASLVRAARFAAAAGWPVHAALLAHALSGFLDTWGDWGDAIDLHRHAVNAWRSTSDAAGEAAALTDLARALGRTGRHAEAADRAEQAVATARAALDQAGEAAALDTLGIIHAMAARYQDALARHDQALSLYHALGQRPGEADALSHGVLSAASLGRHQDALSRAELALAAYREIGDRQGVTNALNNLGGLHQDAGRYAEALTSYQRAKSGFLDLGDRQGEAIALGNIADIRRLSGGHRAAIGGYRAALAIFRDIGDRRSETETLNGLGAAFAGAKEYQAAIEHFEKALALATELVERHAQATSHLGLGAARLATGRYLSAAADFRAALSLSREVADPVQEGQARDGLGCTAARTGGAAAAREHWRAALALFEEAGRPEASAVRARLSASGGQPGHPAPEQNAG